MLLFIALLLPTFSGFASSSDSGDTSFCSMLIYSGAFKGHKYYLSNFYYINVEQALNVCSSCGMYLVEVNDEFEYKFVQNIARNSSTERLLLSGSDKINENDWVFPNNEKVKFLDWSSGNPNNYQRSEHYLALDQMYGYRMNDMKSPPVTIYRFLCEREIRPDDVLDQDI